MQNILAHVVITIKDLLMDEKKEIQSVKTGKVCLESYPCRHKVTIKYKDGTEKKEWADGTAIAEKYHSYLDTNAQRHFAEYAPGFFTPSNGEKNESVEERPHQLSNQL